MIDHLIPVVLALAVTVILGYLVYVILSRSSGSIIGVVVGILGVAVLAVSLWTLFSVADECVDYFRSHRNAIPRK